MTIMSLYTVGELSKLFDDLMKAPVIHTGDWQAMDVSGSKVHGTHEIEDVTILNPRIPDDAHTAQLYINPDLPWAEEHFLERVSGVPHNPPPSHVRWPYAVGGNMAHMSTPAERGGAGTGFARLQFDHTYPERFYPKHAGRCHGSYAYDPSGGIQAVDRYGQGDISDVCGGHSGIRFHYGDLTDVVNLLVRKPLTRQAFLPVWFPEDTGAVDGQRVPCTLGYHFMIRDGKLSCRYYIRSCDAYRHLRNDIYMACRLTQWIVDQFNESPIATEIPWGPGGTTPAFLRPGRLMMHISSLHLFVADVPKVGIKRAA